MLDRMLAFNRALRDAGIPVSVSENEDALRSLECLAIDRREVMRSALAATMIKNASQRAAFDTLFDLYFGTGAGTEAVALRDEHDRDDDDRALEDAVADALEGGDASAMREVARRAVARYGPTGAAGGYSAFQVARDLDLDGILRRLLAEVDEGLPGFERRALEDARRNNVERFRAEVVRDTRRRAAEQRGPEAVARYAIDPLPEDADFLRLSGDLEDLKRAIRPLARRLGTRLGMRRRRDARGQLDVRKTVRHSLSTGGVPFEAAFRHRAPHRPELAVVCDVSGSVARFARFGLMLTHSLAARFTRVRSFAFVDTVDEVTRFFDREDFIEAVDRMKDEAQVTSSDGRTDYGRTFAQLLREYPGAIGPKTTLLILGDARNNYRLRNEDDLRELARKAHRTYWLNPEPRADWDTDDSVASAYAPYVDRMVEVRNLRQLEDFIARQL